MTDEEKQEIANMVSKKKKGLAKHSSLAIIGAVFLVGVFASFENAPISMEKYSMFLGEFGLIISILVGSVGVGYAVKHFKRKD